MNPITRKNPHSVVIFLSALQSTEEKVRGLSLGAMDFITKPFDPDEINARVSLIQTRY